AFIGILLVLITTRQFVDVEDATLIVASMGASAVLLFAVPHGPLSQPWALGCGQLVSAVIGVSCYQLIPDLHLGAAVAVGLSVTAMYYLRCIHPPGGATALSAVMAGPSVHALGYQFIVTPVLINVVTILLVAMLYNFMFSWRRYPSTLARYSGQPAKQNEPVLEGLGRSHLENALRQMNQYIDVSPEDLETIFDLARKHTDGPITASQLKLGHYYSNGEMGVEWSVRRIVDEADDKDNDDGLVIYKVVAGKGRQRTGTMSRKEFAQWAKYEVFLNDRAWERIGSPSSSKV
ncbi:MAG: HPP family protein, partial [Gammaproteobacteria bacterium]